jgi:C-terminal processing protease CtpA/Prc
MQISEDGSGACWSPLGDYIYFSAERGPESGIYRVAAPKGVWAGERIPFIGRVQVDLRKELENLFDEAWTQLRIGFYDPRMHGVDWEAMRKKYRGWAIDAENKDEFHNVVRQMLAELDASHLGIGGGTRTRAVPAVQQTGYLGLDFAQDPEDGGARRVARVLAKGPADAMGLRVGDVVTRIGGTELKADTNLDLLLAGTVGKPVPVAFRPRTERGLEAEKSVDLVPLPAGRVSELAYDAWVLGRKRRVEEATKTKDGEVGYIHLSQMNAQNLQRFVQAVQQWASNPRIRGMILDVRNNGGGNIHGPLIQILTARPLARVTVRGRDPGVQPDTYWDRPVTLLINERSFSDAEVFPFMFKEAKCGKVVGVPTAGGVIGTNDITLSDGSTFRVPRTGFQSMDGRDLEGMGVPPDLLVQETAEDRLSGRDPQLEKAIEVVLAEIAARGKPLPAKPAEEPKPQPSPAPPPVLAAGASHPLADARKGEWVRYRVTGDTGEETLVKVTVARVESGEVFFDKEVEKGPAPTPPFPAKMERKGVLDLLPAFGQVLGHNVVQGKVRDADAEILDARVKWPDGSEIRLEFTNAVPAYGLWRVRAGKQVVVEAIEWGAPAAAEEKPAVETPGNPLFDAKVGEWVRVRMAGPRGEFEMTRKVLAVTDDEVTIGMTAHMGGESRELDPMRRPRTRLLVPQGGEPATYAREKRTVAGREMDCIVMTYVREGAEEKAWFSPEVPVTGVVHAERAGTVVLDLLDWGKD